MVKIMENPIKMDDLEGFPIFLETTKWRAKDRNKVGDGSHQPVYNLTS